MLYVTISCPFFNRRHAISKHVKRIEDYSMFHSPAFSLPLECNKLHKDRRMTLHCPPGLSKAHRHTWHIWNHLITLQIFASPNRERKYIVGNSCFNSGIFKKINRSQGPAMPLEAMPAALCPGCLVQLFHIKGKGNLLQQNIGMSSL